MYPFASRRVVTGLRYASAALAGLAVFFVIGGLVLTTTTNGLFLASMIGAAVAVLAGIAFGAARRFDSRMVGEEIDPPTAPGTLR